MQTVRVSDETSVVVSKLANREGLTIPEATDRLINAGFNRLSSLKKWRRKEKRIAARSHR